MNRNFSTAKKLNHIWMITIAIFLLCGCGSSGDGGDPIICPGSPGCPKQNLDYISDFVGTYELQGFTIEDESIEGQITENDYDTWCGQMVVTSQGEIMLDKMLAGNMLYLRWEILSVTDNELELKRVPDPFNNYTGGECTEWVDYILEDNSLTLMFPQDSCVGITYVDMKLFRTSMLEDYPADDSCVSDEGATGATGAIVPEIVGHYLASAVTYSLGDNIIDLAESDGGWSGELMISSENVINLILTSDQGVLPFMSWQIEEGLDDDGDGRIDSLRVTDMFSCQQTLLFFYDETENILSLTLTSGNDCPALEMRGDFIKVNSTNQTSNPLL